MGTSTVPSKRPSTYDGVLPLSTGGYTTGEGLAYLHKRELVVDSRATQAIERMTAPRARSGGGGGNVINIGPLNYVAPAGESNATHRKRAKEMNREQAEAIAEILSRQMGLAMQMGGSIPQMVDQSYHARIAGIPS